MNLQKELAESFGTTSWLVSRFGEGMTNEDSIALPSFRANSFNWVLGHILVSRDRALSMLNQKVVLKPEEKALYETGSEQLDPNSAVPLECLLAAMEESQERLTQGLLSTSMEALDAIYDEKRQQTVGDRLAGLHWHETYHVGQLEILRQVNREFAPFP